MLHLRASDYRVMPWKDGGGTTTEIAIEPAGSSLSDPFVWRASSAQVAASGPFSRFPGYERVLVLLEGTGLILDLEGHGRKRLKHLAMPLTFTGDAAVHATLIQGPCLDFGVISDPRRVKVLVQVLSLGPDAVSHALAPSNLFFAPQGKVRLDPVGVHLGPLEALRIDAGEPTTLGSGEPAEVGKRLGLRASEAGVPLVAVAFWPT